MRGDLDAVLTTRELARMIRHRKINFASLRDDAAFDSPHGESTGAAAIFGASGGVMEAALRTAANVLQLEDAPLEWKAVRGVAEAGVKVAEVPGVGSVAVVNSIGAAVDLFASKDERAWRKHLMIEVMACKGGCLGGGGEPKSDNPNILQERARGIYAIDASAKKRMSHENEEVQALYDQWLGKPLSHVAEQELHTIYSPRRSPREALARFLDAVDNRDGKTAGSLFVPDGVWHTNMPSFGDVVGPKQIEALVSTKLPPNPLRRMRHRLEAEGLTVRAPSGETVQFEVKVDGKDASKILALSRHVVSARP
jgi:NADH-quinone oxidoreductase subunit G